MIWIDQNYRDYIYLYIYIGMKKTAIVGQILNILFLYKASNNISQNISFMVMLSCFF